MVIQEGLVIKAMGLGFLGASKGIRDSVWAPTPTVLCRSVFQVSLLSCLPIPLYSSLSPVTAPVQPLTPPPHLSLLLLATPLICPCALC